MAFISNAYTDVGIKKKTNQDSALLMEAQTDLGDVALCVICDGMGGLAEGELASAHVIKAFSAWFKNELKEMLYNGFSPVDLEKSWSNIIYNKNTELMLYTRENNIAKGLGTTVAALLLYDSKYYILNVGDSRIYRHNGELVQLTEDQTFINREVKLGNMTPEQAATDPRRSVLLQCVGASQFVEPEYEYGSFSKEDTFILCSDGFRHEVSHKELEDAFMPHKLKSDAKIAQIQKQIVELNKKRMETDNITVITIKAI